MKDEPEDSSDDQEEEKYDDDQDVEMKKSNGASRAQRMAARQTKDVKMENATSPNKKATVKKEEKTPAKLPEPVKKQDEEDNRPTKRMKVDHDEQVSQLFQASEAKVEATIRQKRCVFTLIQSNKDHEGTVKVDILWRKYLELPEKEAFEKGKPIFNNKNEMIVAINALDADGCAMHIQDEAKVILV